MKRDEELSAILQQNRRLREELKEARYLARRLWRERARSRLRCYVTCEVNGRCKTQNQINDHNANLRVLGESPLDIPSTCVV